jgi:hypothetical protein
MIVEAALPLLAPDLAAVVFAFAVADLEDLDFPLARGMRLAFGFDLFSGIARLLVVMSGKSAAPVADYSSET